MFEEGPAIAGPFRLSASPGPLVLEGLRGRRIGPIDLRVEAGEAAAVIGPSGAGKSLLLRMVADLDPSEGLVRLGDRRRATMPAPEWRRRVGLVPAEPGWWAPDVAAHFYADAVARSELGAHRLGLPADIMTRAVATLSTGERQRLALLRALSRSPAALLLDEPTSALDPASIEAVLSLLREAMAAGLALLFVTHDDAVAERLGARRYAMAAGRLTPA